MAKSSLHNLKEDVLFQQADETASAWAALGHLANSAHENWGRIFQNRIVEEMERRYGELRADAPLLHFLKECAGVDLYQCRRALAYSNYYDFQWFIGRLAAYALTAQGMEQSLGPEGAAEPGAAPAPAYPAAPMAPAAPPAPVVPVAPPPAPAETVYPTAPTAPTAPPPGWEYPA